MDGRTCHNGNILSIEETVGKKIYKLYGANYDLMDWFKNSELGKAISSQANISNDEIFQALGGDWPQECINVSRELIKKLWYSFPSLGQYPFLDTLSEFQFGGIYYSGYRDHVCHQLKVFLLGLFVYDKCPNVKESIDEMFGEIRKDLNSSFTCCWLATAVYHDIGYIFENEGATPNSNIWEKIKNDINNSLETPLSQILEIDKKKERDLKGITKINSCIVRDQDEINYHIDKNGNKIDLLSLLNIEAKKNHLCEGSNKDFNAFRAYYQYANTNKTDLGNRSPFKDHGIASALLLLFMWFNFREYVEGISNKLQNLSIGSLIEKDFANNVIKKIYDLNTELTEHQEGILIAAGAMAVHNIVPGEWRSQFSNMGDLTLDKFRIHLTGKNASPIAFLLGLTDTLQDWDRPRFRSPTKDDKRIPISQDMSITTVDNKMHIFFAKDDNYCKCANACDFSQTRTVRNILCEYLSENDVDNVMFWDLVDHHPRLESKVPIWKHRYIGADHVPAGFRHFEKFSARSVDCLKLVKWANDVSDENFKHSVTIILGESGAGKSSLAWHFFESSTTHRWRGKFFWCIHEDETFEPLFNDLIKFMRSHGECQWDIDESILEPQRKMKIVVDVLRLEPFLIVLDGFERTLDRWREKTFNRTTANIDADDFLAALLLEDKIASRIIITSQPRSKINKYQDRVHMLNLDNLDPDSVWEIYRNLACNDLCMNEENKKLVIDAFPKHLSSPILVAILAGITSENAKELKEIANIKQQSKDFTSQKWLNEYVLGQLRDETLEVLKMVSLYGTLCSKPILGLLMEPMSSEELDINIKNLLNLKLLKYKSLHEKDSYFCHQVVSDAVWGRLTPSERWKCGEEKFYALVNNHYYDEAYEILMGHLNFENFKQKYSGNRMKLIKRLLGVEYRD
jgi:hypothetical protein